MRRGKDQHRLASPLQWRGAVGEVSRSRQRRQRGDAPQPFVDALVRRASARGDVAFAVRTVAVAGRHDDRRFIEQPLGEAGRCHSPSGTFAQM